MKDKNKLIAIILVIVTVLVVVITYFIERDNEQVSNDIEIVKNYSDFYTVNSCLYRVVTYLFTQNTDDLLLILNDEYKEENNITEENVLSLFDPVEYDSTFVSEKMYYEKISQNITKYYVKGYIEKNQILDESDTVNLDKKQVYFIVYLDSENSLFSIEPYSGDIFIGGVINEE